MYSNDIAGNGFSSIPLFLPFLIFLWIDAKGKENHIQRPPIPGQCLRPKTLAERKRLLNYGVSFWHWGSAYRRDRGTQWWWKRNVLDFQRKKGAGQREKRLKDVFLTVVACSRQRPAQHSGSILFLPFANSDSVIIRFRAILFKTAKVANFCSSLNHKTDLIYWELATDHKMKLCFLYFWAIWHYAFNTLVIYLFFSSSLPPFFPHDLSAHTDPHKFSISTSPLPSVSVSSHT